MRICPHPTLRPSLTPGSTRASANSGVKRGTFSAEQSLTTLNILPGIPSSRPATPDIMAGRSTCPQSHRADSQSAHAPRLATESDATLTVTLLPDVSATASLEATVDEARQKMSKGHQTVAGRSLVEAAEKKELEMKREIERCARMRLDRLHAFETCDEVSTVLQPLYEAFSTSSKTSGAGQISAPRHTDLLNFHLTIIREGLLDSKVVGSERTSFPYCYAPPAYIRSKYVSRELGGEAREEEGELGSGGGHGVIEDYTAEHGSTSAEEIADSPLACWDGGVLAWRLLQARGDVKRFAHTLTFEGLRRIVFELADMSFTQNLSDLLAGRSVLVVRRTTRENDMEVSLQEYVDFAWRLVERCLVVPLVDSSPPSPEPVESTPYPPTQDSRLKESCTAMRTLKFSWPAYDAHFSTTIRRHALLRAGVREHQNGAQSVESAAREFRTMRRLVLAFGTKRYTRGPKLSYSQMLKAFQAMPGHNYLDLIFRDNVVCREVKGSPAEILEQATRDDAEQMVCFMRWIDRDCDGYISEKDYSVATTIQASGDCAAALVTRWQEAAVKMDKPSFKGGARGVLDKIGGNLMSGLSHGEQAAPAPAPVPKQQSVLPWA